jgi:putative flippase GtrA
MLPYKLGRVGRLVETIKRPERIVGTSNVQSTIFGLSRQGFRYLLVAGTTALFYLGLVAGGIAVGLNYLIAILCAQVITIFCAFPFYRRFVFESRGRVRVDFVRFIVVWSSGAIAGIVVTPLLVQGLKWQPLVAQVVAIAVVSVFSFLGHRYFSFRESRRTPSNDEAPPR